MPRIQSPALSAFIHDAVAAESTLLKQFLQKMITGKVKMTPNIRTLLQEAHPEGKNVFGRLRYVPTKLIRITMEELVESRVDSLFSKVHAFARTTSGDITVPQTLQLEDIQRQMRDGMNLYLKGKISQPDFDQVFGVQMKLLELLINLQVKQNLSSAEIKAINERDLAARRKHTR
jgi:hypothetical protein